jgi:hypothetical protein
LLRFDEQIAAVKRAIAISSELVGQLYTIGATVIVDATEVERVERPKQPYLNPWECDPCRS